VASGSSRERRGRSLAGRIGRGVAASLAAVLVAAPAAAAEEGSPEVRGAMRKIAAPLQVALPLALSEGRFSDPAHHAELAAALAELARSASVLEEHGAKREVSFTFMSRSLARDAEEVDRRFREGRPDEARFLLGELAQDCIGCHSRLPSPGDSDLGAALFASVDPADLDPFEAIRLQILTRQFSTALAGCEALLASPAWPPPRLDLEGVLEDLLLLAVRVERQPERARVALEGFGARGDVPIHLAETTRAWVSSLTTLASEPDGADTDLFARAERAAHQGQAMRRYPADRRGDVFDLQASSLLHRYLEQKEGELAKPRRAEAYYLLGLTELRRTESFWPSAADFYLEQAIRLAPHRDTARAAYAVLEEHTVIGYTGSGGLQLPPEIAEWLEELHALAD
jgi:hypothetical protein